MLTVFPSFTTSGIVAFVFTCIAGVLGVGVVAWYGMAEVKDGDHADSADGRTSGDASLWPSASPTNEVMETGVTSRTA